MSMIISSEPALKYIIELETILAIIIVSAWGGVVSYLMREARGRKKKKYSRMFKTSHYFMFYRFFTLWHCS